MIKAFLLVIGGAIGSALRFGALTWVQRPILYPFPFSILSVNVVGPFSVGLCWNIAETYDSSIDIRTFLFTGLFSGFTTFSSSVLDTVVLMRIGKYKMILLNVLASNILGLIVVFLEVTPGRSTIMMTR